ncbi:LutC/YkgG family protein [Methyloligella solikamskensis]|uniref:Lactate utilization protein C n=1 Tax=Methyloligella solikamskensis TaxID=1177756 RepID=A0ABW3JBE9_9HYPH
MSERSRDHILSRIRNAVGEGSADRASRAELEGRLASPQSGPLPALDDDGVSRFIAKAEGNGLTVEPIVSLDLLVPAVGRVMSDAGVSTDISIAPALADLPWPEPWLANIGAGRFEEHISVTLAAAGIAETGSVIFRSGPDSPATLNFLPDIHVVVLRTADIVTYPEEAWQRFRDESNGWPRAMNVIAGPSRTADVGGIIVRPAHGPKAVHLLLVGND